MSNFTQILGNCYIDMLLYGESLCPQELWKYCFCVEGRYCNEMSPGSYLFQFKTHIKDGGALCGTSELGSGWQGTLYIQYFFFTKQS